MAKVRATIDHCPEELQLNSGATAKFVSHASGGFVSSEMSNEDAAALATCKGFELFEAKVEGAGSTPTGVPGGAKVSSPEEEAELNDLRVRGVAAGVPNAEVKGLKKLREEVPAAEKAKADADAAAAQAQGSAEAK